MESLTRGGERDPGCRACSLFALGALLLLLLRQASGHPQCLDFKPPFKPLRPLAFCAQYSDFGCCDAQRDSALLERFYSVTERLDHAAYAACASHLQDLLCQVSGGGEGVTRPPLKTHLPSHSAKMQSWRI